MAAWFGLVMRGGKLVGSRDEDSLGLAQRLVGEDGLLAFREWLEVTPRDEREVAVCASFEVCAWMIQADGELDHEERELFQDMLAHSDLRDELQEQMVHAVDDLPSLVDLEQRLVDPILRELTFGLCWEIAVSNGEIVPMERAFHTGLASRLQIEEARANEIRAEVETRPSLFDVSPLESA